MENRNTTNISTYKTNYSTLETVEPLVSGTVKLKDFKQHKNSVNNRINTIRRNLGGINDGLDNLNNNIDALNLYEEQHKKDLNSIKETEDLIKSSIYSIHESNNSSHEHTKLLLYTGIGIGIINIICSFINFFI